MSSDLARVRAWDRAAVLACAVVTFLAFLPSLRNGFVVTWDDGGYVTGNPAIRELSAGMVAWAFTSFHSHFWAPLTWISFALDHAIWGLDPLGYHLTNVLLHALDAGLACLVIRALLALGGPGLEPRHLRTAALVAALGWALHPLRVESVAWISERKDVLSAAFGLAALLAWLRHVRPADPSSQGQRHHLLALGLFAASLGAKPALTPLPLVLLVLDWYPLRRPATVGWRRLLVEKLPWVALSAVATGLTMAAHADVAIPLEVSGYGSRVLIALRAIVDYLRLAAWPAGLSPFYLHPLQVSALDPAYLLPALAVAGLMAAALWQAGRRPALLAGWLAYLALLAPGLASTQVSLTAMADRFSYLPDLVLATLLGAGLLRALPGAAGRLAVAAALGILAAWAALTVRQIGVWRDDVTLWTRAIEVRPHFSGRAYAQRAGAFEARGDWAAAVADMDEAVAIAVARRHSHLHQVLARRAHVRAGAGDLEGAVEDLGRAVEAAPPAVRPALHQERARLWRVLGRDDLADDELRRAAAGPP